MSDRDRCTMILLNLMKPIPKAIRIINNLTKLIGLKGVEDSG